MIELLFKRVGGSDQQELPKVFKIEDFTYYLEKSIRKYHKSMPDLKEKYVYLDSPAAALRKLQVSSYSEVPPCSFHDENYRIEFCSLALVRNRAFTMMDRLCDVSFF